MDAALWEHQREIAVVVRHRSVLISSTQPIGKTFVSCALLCESAASNPQQLALAISCVAIRTRQHYRLNLPDYVDYV
ncbi:unnamed protein product [Peronospora destructor]|uniref:Uncharacterized protein n=1 Tax=Peronospora destructor TaxID=86335 RepID=A0AAV0UQT0_9STRA|nr:unnamed protein product [Peronospora destructor]